MNSSKSFKLKEEILFHYIQISESLVVIPLLKRKPCQCRAIDRQAIQGECVCLYFPHLPLSLSLCEGLYNQLKHDAEKLKLKQNLRKIQERK